jgi:hypothetical protein
VLALALAELAGSMAASTNEPEGTSQALNSKVQEMKSRGSGSADSTFPPLAPDKRERKRQSTPQPSAAVTSRQVELPRDELAAPPDTDSLFVAPGAELRGFVPGTPMAGLRIAAGARRWGVGGAWIRGTTQSDLGLISATITHGFVAFKAIEAPLGAMTVASSGLRAGAGLVSVRGDPNQGLTGTDASAPYVDCAAFGRVEQWWTRHISLRLVGEVGFSRGLVALADAEPAARFGGAFIGGVVELVASAAR